MANALSLKDTLLLEWAKAAEAVHGMDVVQERMAELASTSLNEDDADALEEEVDGEEEPAEREQPARKKQRLDVRSMPASSDTHPGTKRKAKSVLHFQGTKPTGRSQEDSGSGRGLGHHGHTQGTTRQPAGNSSSLRCPPPALPSPPGLDKRGCLSRHHTPTGEPKGVLGELAKKALAQKTAKMYNKCLTDFGRITKVTNIRDIQECHVNDFMEWAFKQSKKKAWASSHLAAVSYYTRLAGAPDPTHGALTRYALKGWSKMEGVKTDTRRPLNFAKLKILLDTLPAVCNNAYETSLFRAAFTLNYFGAFRISEIASKNTGSEEGLDIGDIHMGKDSMAVKLCRSKTNQLGKGRIINLYCIEETEYCPICTTKAFMSKRTSRGGQLFTHKNGSALSRFQLRSVLKKTIIAIGWNPTEFGSHSFRIGAATSAWMGGMQEKAIKGIGGWRSGAYKRYIRKDLI
ncbi:uncharacterized protein [Ambystoma mexicanum]|uniref:uncharacterized protein n=1 Tax=Ambystoma mexicanum TaxID=8296 RepID=UPI0037E727B6